MTKLLETQDLVTNFYTYEGMVQALNRVSLVVEEGSTFGLVGESGCGKSVTVRSIMRIVQPPGRIEGGRVLVYFGGADQDHGLDLLMQSEEYMRGLRGCDMSMIFQEPNAALNPTLSIGYQVSESFLFHQTAEMSRKILDDWDQPGQAPALAGLLKPLYQRAAANPKDMLLAILSRIPILRRWRKPLLAEAKARSIDIIGKLGIPNPERVVDAFPHNLSGGMKQRIVIAMALACNPVLLIADEATSNLDVTIQAQILDLLVRLKKESISSILLITHDLGVVAETCDRVGVMYAGNLVEVGPVQGIFAHPRHPYTQALLDSVPKFQTEGELKSIEGAVPNLVSPPPGCRFHPRCPHMMDVCRDRLPDLLDADPGHQVACHWAEQNRAGGSA
jgi:peptide/nickel transport system ATP-binding protein